MRPSAKRDCAVVGAATAAPTRTRPRKSASAVRRRTSTAWIAGRTIRWTAGRSRRRSSRRGWLVALGFFGALLGFVCHLLPELAALLAGRPGTAGWTWLAWRRSCGRFLRILGLFVFLVLVRRIRRGGSRLRRLGQRNPADDFVGYLRIRIHDDAHRDVEIVAIRRGRCLRERHRKVEHEYQTEAPHEPHDALASHAMSPLIRHVHRHADTPRAAFVFDHGDDAAVTRGARDHG